MVLSLPINVIQTHNPPNLLIFPSYQFPLHTEITSWEMLLSLRPCRASQFSKSREGGSGASAVGGQKTAGTSRRSGPLELQKVENGKSSRDSLWDF